MITDIVLNYTQILT